MGDGDRGAFSCCALRCCAAGGGGLLSRDIAVAPPGRVFVISSFPP